MMAMRDGICPECGSAEIYTRNGWFHNIIVAFSPPRTNVYVCGHCGYLAEFISEGGHLEYIKKNWSRHQSPEKRKRDEVEQR
jgi:ribosomal protein S27AE